MLRTVFMGTPDFAVPALEAFHGFTKIAAVYTQPDRPAGRGHGLKEPAVKVKARALGLEVRQPEKLTLPGEFERLAELKPDLILVVAYGQILRKQLLELPRLGCVNIHSSLLPRWRGAAPIHWAILGGDPETGVTTQRMVEKLDAGAILLQKRTAIGADETLPSLHDRLAGLGAELVRPTVEGLENGTLQAVPQDEAKVTLASKLRKEMEWLDGSLSAEDAHRRIRALNPWPGTSLRLESGERLRVRSTGPLADVQGAPGAGVVFERDARVYLSCRGGSVELREVQWDGKRPVGPAEFLNGMRGQGRLLPVKVAPAPKAEGN